MYVLSCGAAALFLAVSGTVREKQTARFAGDWVICELESDGQVTGEKDIEVILAHGRTLTLKGNTYLSKFMTFATSHEESGTFAVVEGGADGLRVDLRGVETYLTDTGRPPPRKIHRKELWRWVDAKTFRRCFPLDSAGDRPKAFAPKKGDGTILVTYRRKEK